MPLDQQTAAVSLALSILIVVVAALLVVWQWYECRHRATELSEADASHFARQDVRRWMVTVILILLAVGVTLGSRIEAQGRRADEPAVLPGLARRHPPDLRAALPGDA